MYVHFTKVSFSEEQKYPHKHIHNYEITQQMQTYLSHEDKVLILPQ